MTNDETYDRLAQLCHDLRQHVAAALMLAADRPGDESLPLDVRQRMGLVVDELRAVSEVLSAESRTTIQLVDLTDLAAECARTAQNAHGVRVHLTVEACPVLLIESTSVRRAINNLLDNAARASRSGTVEVVVRLHRGYGAVEVHDDGLGFGTIPAKSGWGLTQVRATMDAHGGLLERGPSRSGGTMMRVSLPMHRNIVEREAERAA